MRAAIPLLPATKDAATGTEGDIIVTLDTDRGVATIRRMLPAVAPHVATAMLSIAASKVDARVRETEALTSDAGLPALRTHLAALLTLAAVTAAQPTPAPRYIKRDHRNFEDALSDRLRASAKRGRGCSLDFVLDSIVWPKAIPADTRAAWLRANPRFWVVGDAVMCAGHMSALESVAAVQDLCSVDAGNTAASPRAAAQAPSTVTTEGALTARVAELEATNNELATQVEWLTQRVENLGTEKGDLAAAKDALAARVEALAAANGELEANVFCAGGRKRRTGGRQRRAGG